MIASSVPYASSYVESFQLVERLRGIQLDNRHVLLFLDVVSLFTNIPFDLAIDTVVKRLDNILDNTNIPNEFILALKMILESTYFTFNNVIYRQNFGTPMGSPLSPIIADLVLRDIESRAINILNIPLPIYFRYVDDILLAAPSDSVNDIVNTFNSFHPRLQFTLEVGGGNLNFLDVTIVNFNGKLEFDWFHKSTFSGRYLNYNFQHALSQKRGTIIGMVDRTFILSHPKYHQKNLKLIVEILRLNDYPLKLIFDTINSRLKYLISDHTQIQSNNRVSNKPNQWFIIPFISALSHKFKNITNDLGSSISYYSMNKLSNIIRPQKDQLPMQQHRNVVYKISCGTATLLMWNRWAEK